MTLLDWGAVPLALLSGLQLWRRCGYLLEQAALHNASPAELPLECLPEFQERIEGTGRVAEMYPNVVTNAVSVRRPSAAPLKEEEVGVCIEGPLLRTDLPLLTRMASALRGLNNGAHRVVAVPSVPWENAAECEEGGIAQQWFGAAFGKSLFGFRCIVDAQDKAREKGLYMAHFLRSMPNEGNRSWWKHNLHSLTTIRQMYLPTEMWAQLQNMRMKEHCLELFEGLEGEEEFGQKFSWLVYLRIDLDFFAPHPPLFQMASVQPAGMWFPDTEDFGGVYDRWAVVPRAMADAYFRRAEVLSDGSVLHLLQLELQANGNRSSMNTLNQERMLLIALRRHGVWPKLVFRFLSTAATICLSWPNEGCQIGASGMGTGGWGYRSRPEFNEAYHVASRLQHGCWRWQLTGQQRILQPLRCPLDCCHKRAGLGDPLVLDGQFLSHARCCTSNVRLSIAKSQCGSQDSPASAASEQLSNRLPDCWNSWDGLSVLLERPAYACLSREGEILVGAWLGENDSPSLWKNLTGLPQMW